MRRAGRQRKGSAALEPPRGDEVDHHDDGIASVKSRMSVSASVVGADQPLAEVHVVVAVLAVRRHDQIDDERNEPDSDDGGPPHFIRIGAVDPQLDRSFTPLRELLARVLDLLPDLLRLLFDLYLVLRRSLD